jgi:hypothetical protein
MASQMNSLNKTIAGIESGDPKYRHRTSLQLDLLKAARQAILEGRQPEGDCLSSPEEDFAIVPGSHCSSTFQLAHANWEWTPSVSPVSATSMWSTLSPSSLPLADMPPKEEPAFLPPLLSHRTQPQASVPDHSAFSFPPLQSLLEQVEERHREEEVKEAYEAPRPKAITLPPIQSLLSTL